MGEGVERSALMEKLRMICVESIQNFSMMGLEEFSLVVRSREFNFSVDTNGKVNTHTTTRKKRSPASLRRSKIRRQLFLQKKLDQHALQPEDISPPEVLHSSGATLTTLNSSFRCDNCDTSYKSSKSLSVHQARQHNGKIAQIDGIFDSTELIDRTTDPTESEQFSTQPQQQQQQQQSSQSKAASYTYSTPMEKPKFNFGPPNWNVWRTSWDRNRSELREEIDQIHDKYIRKICGTTTQGNMEDDEEFANSIQKIRFNF